jgi:hypothetical protein
MIIGLDDVGIGEDLGAHGREDHIHDNVGDQVDVLDEHEEDCKNIESAMKMTLQQDSHKARPVQTGRSEVSTPAAVKMNLLEEGALTAASWTARGQNDRDMSVRE